MPLMMLNTVVLPAPLGPISPSTWPLERLKVTAVRVFTPPKLLWTSSTSRRGAISGLHCARTSGGSPRARLMASSIGRRAELGLGKFRRPDDIVLAAIILDHREGEPLHEGARLDFISRNRSVARLLGKRIILPDSLVLAVQQSRR